MAEGNTNGAQPRVRDMYEGTNRARMSKTKKKAHIEETLNNDRDVLFRIFQGLRLHMVMLRTDHPGEWMRGIQRRITSELSLQLTKKRPVIGIFTITMSGSEEELIDFCAGFNQLHDQVMGAIQTEEQGNPEDDVEALRARIRELELENRRLREQ